MALGRLLLCIWIPIDGIWTRWRGMNCREESRDLGLRMHVGQPADVVELSLKVVGGEGWEVVWTWLILSAICTPITLSEA